VNRKPSLPNDPIPPRLWTLLHLSQYAAFILSIIFTATGQEDLSYASAIVVACLFVVLVGIVSVFYFELRRAPAVSTQSSTSSSEPEEDDDNPTMKEPSTGEDTRKPPPPILSKRKTTTFLHILLVSIPFLAVRVIYILLATFTHDSMFTGREPDDNETTESWTTATEMETYILPNVYLVAFMQYAVEIVVFGLFVGAGFVVPASRRGWRTGQKESKERSEEGHGDSDRDELHVVELGDTSSRRECEGNAVGAYRSSNSGSA
jgi:hypothetical protein